MLLKKLVEVNVLGKEGMLLDLFCTTYTKTLGRVTGEEAGEDAARLRADVVAEDKRVLQDLLVHLLRVFYTKCRYVNTHRKRKD